MLCGHHFEILNNFIFDLMLGKRNLMGQPSRTARPGTLTIPHAGEDAEPQERSLGAGGKAKWRRRPVRQFGDFLQNEARSDHRVQPLCSLVFAQRS